jgi:hypothetical protein
MEVARSVAPVFAAFISSDSIRGLLFLANESRQSRFDAIASHPR